MGKLTLITGGVRSGKSAYGQQLAEQKGHDVAYIATAIVTDEEMRHRVEKHKLARPFHWKTYECPYQIADKLADARHELYLIDCIGTYLTNLLMKLKDDWDNDTLLAPEEQAFLEREIGSEVDKLIKTIRQCKRDCIAVTNEVGWGVVPQSAMGRLFRDVAGRANQALAAAADEVYLVACGIPMRIKG